MTGFLRKIVGGGIGAISDGVAGAIDRFVETKDEKRAADILLTKMTQDKEKWQAEINKIGASNRNLFIAGARPCILWICAIGLFVHFILFPIIEWIAILSGNSIKLPALNYSDLMILVWSLLGLGILRTFEKWKGLTK